MKKVFKSVLVFASMAALLTVSSCTKECDPGYEGDDCKTEMRAKFIDDWLVSGTDTDGDTYTNVPVEVASSSVEVDRVAITWDNSVNFYGNVEGSNLTIPSQTVGGEAFSGSGTVSGNTINFTITVGAGAGSFTITASGPRQ